MTGLREGEASMYSILLLGCAAVVAAIVFFSTSGLVRAGSSDAAAKPPVTVRRVKSMTQQQIRDMLANIEKKTAPEPKMGAMCYDRAAPPDRAEYVCPKCGEKTLYTKEAAWKLQFTVEFCRREFLPLRKCTALALALDESSYCSRCRPDAKEHEMALIVTYEDGSSYTNSPVDKFDLAALTAFLKGGAECKTFNDGTRPLKEMLPRLRELLGVQAK